MKCPKCMKKMVFDKENKDYFCDHCDLSLAEIKRESDISSDKENNIKVDEQKKETDQIQPLSGTPRGILFMLLGSLILILNPVLMFVCQFFPVIGLFLLIMGFFLVYQDRKKYNIGHIKNMKFSVTLFITWLVIYIMTNIYLAFISYDLTTKLAKYGDKDIIPESIIMDYYNSVYLLPIVLFLLLGLMAIFRYLTITELIQKNLKNILKVSVILIIITGMISMFLTMNAMNDDINNLSESTKEEFFSNNLNSTSNMAYDSTQLYYGLTMLNISAEAIMIMCYYWTYKLLKDEFVERI